MNSILEKEKKLNLALTKLKNLNLENPDIKKNIDIVDVFRPSREVLAIAEDTVKIGAKVLWLQLGIRDENAKELVEKNHIEYVENKCTKMEYQKHFLKVRQAFPVLSD